MNSQWTDLAAVVVLVCAGCIAVYAGVARVLLRALNEREKETDRQLGDLSATVKALETRVAEMSSAQPSRNGANETPGISGTEENIAGEESAYMTRETLAVITAATTAAIAKKARIRSVQPVPPGQIAEAWAQQGRVSVQTSHNVRSRN